MAELHGQHSGRQLKDCTDEELALSAHDGCDESLAVLLSRYFPIVSYKAYAYPQSLLDKDDLVQEGMIALLKAVHSYSEDRNTAFCTYANVCIGNSIKSALRDAGRLKHMPLNDYIPLDGEEIGDGVMGEISGDLSHSPEALVIKKEEFAFLREKMNSLLSGLEREILMLYLKGCTYEQIAISKGVTAKTVDNAMQRVRKKLGSVML